MTAYLTLYTQSQHVKTDAAILARLKRRHMKARSRFAKQGRVEARDNAVQCLSMNDATTHKVRVMARACHLARMLVKGVPYVFVERAEDCKTRPNEDSIIFCLSNVMDARDAKQKLEEWIAPKSAYVRVYRPTRV